MSRKRTEISLRIIVVIMFGLCAAEAFCQDAPKILLIARNESSDLSFFIEKEALPMKDLLQKAGYRVDVTIPSGKAIKVGKVKLACDVALSAVQLDQYRAIVIPCMGGADYKVPAEMVSLVKEADSRGLFIALQHSPEVFLATGIVKGRKIATGPGVVCDGKLITAENCPMTAKGNKMPIDTDGLMEALVAALKEYA